MTRDYEREREKPTVHRTYTKADGRKVHACGPLKPYNELLEALRKTARTLGDEKDYDAMRRLAWELGINGEHDACEIIITELNKPRQSTYAYWG